MSEDTVTLASDLSDAAENVLGFFVAHFVLTSIAGFYYTVYELADKLCLGSEETREAVRELVNAGILSQDRHSNPPYLYLRKRYLQEQGLLLLDNAATTTNPSPVPSRSDVPRGATARVPHILRTVVETPKELKDLEIQNPGRIHKVTETFSARGNLTQQQLHLLRQACKTKHEENWNALPLKFSTLRISRYGTIQVYLNLKRSRDLDYLARNAFEEIVTFCQEQCGFSIRKIPVDKIKIRSRLRIDLGSLDELAESISHLGLINPITVSLEGNGSYLLLAGERRLRACEKIGLKTVDARIIRWNKQETGMK
jgi:hypothetical protein